MFRRSFERVGSPLVVSALLIAVVTVAAGPQENSQKAVPTDRKAQQPPREPPLRPPGTVNSSAEARAEIDKMLGAYDLKPHPLPPIPDDPPPHEGAMISLPNVVEPPDLVIVEVLETLPGRPISGERLVRPDGSIDLGFYGELHVRGLTPHQIEIALIKHLRRFLPDETLGLKVPLFDEEAEQPAAAEPIKTPKPEIPQGQENVFKELEKPRASFDRPRSSHTHRVLRRGSRSPTPVRLVRAQETRVKPQVPEGPAIAQNPFQINAGGKGQVIITIEIEGGRPLPLPQPVQPEPPPVSQGEGPWQIVPPEEGGCVFVDIIAYNSRNYYVLGDVLVPGRLPWTGNETVLDAMQNAQGLIPSADPKNIRLVRPGREGKPAKVYSIDLIAIQEQGNTLLNYQLLPGDRLVVGRDEVVKKTSELDRLNAPLQSVTSSILQTAFALRYLQIVRPEQSDKLLKEFVDFWAKEVSRKGDLKLDEQKLRELLIHELKPGVFSGSPGFKTQIGATRFIPAAVGLWSRERTAAQPARSERPRTW